MYSNTVRCSSFNEIKAKYTKYGMREKSTQGQIWHNIKLSVMLRDTTTFIAILCTSQAHVHDNPNNAKSEMKS